MANRERVEALVKAARAELDDPTRTRVVGVAGTEPPRFELFHAGMSMCSQKVRAVLAEKAIPYTSHELVIVASKGIYSEDFKPAENYRPAYVRLRIQGGKEFGATYAEAHTGSSSVETEGFDACVVPLLIDHDEARVIADSKRICEHLDAAAEGPISLVPEEPAARAAVMKQVDAVDRTPHPAFLYGFHPDDDRRPDFIKAVMTDVHDIKCDSLQRFIDANVDDAELVAAYQSKIAKERAGKALAFDAERQRAVRTQAQEIVDAFDTQLGESEGPWLFGDRFSLADVVWGISLFRMHWLGMASLWSGKPRVSDYAKRAYQRPSLDEQVIHYPSPMPPSPHLAVGP